jgi:hypothetical protein
MRIYVLHLFIPPAAIHAERFRTPLRRNFVEA